MEIYAGLSNRREINFIACSRHLRSFGGMSGQGENLKLFMLQHDGWFRSLRLICTHIKYQMVVGDVAAKPDQTHLVLSPQRKWEEMEISVGCSDVGKVGLCAVGKLLKGSMLAWCSWSNHMGFLLASANAGIWRSQVSWCLLSNAKMLPCCCLCHLKIQQCKC